MNNNIGAIDDMLAGVEKMLEEKKETNYEPTVVEPIVEVNNHVSEPTNQPIVEQVRENTPNYNIEFNMPTAEVKPVVEVKPVAEIKQNNSTDINSIFDTLSSDIAGANNFMSTLMEQKKNVNLNENYLAEQKEKFEKEKKDFEKYMAEQKDLIKLSKDKLEEYERNQKIRLQSEDAQFSAEVESTRNELALLEQAIRNEQEKVNSDKQQFNRYKDAEEEMLKTANQKLDADKIQFEKYKEVEEEKIKLAKQENEKTKTEYNLEHEKALNMFRNKEDELEEQKLQFEKYKEVEKKKLELESKNLSQSCARFKELVSQFNLGFKQIPGKE